MQEEIWGENQDTWIASPYAPMGVARPVEGGFIFNGHWQFSSGTDHCDWVVIGGFVANPDGTPNKDGFPPLLPPAGRLRDPAGFLGRRGPEGHRLQGPGGQGRLRARLPGGAPQEGGPVGRGPGSRA